MEPKVKLDHDILQLIAELDEFKGRWTATYLLAPDRLKVLRQVAIIESIGSSTRIEGAKLSDPVFRPEIRDRSAEIIEMFLSRGYFKTQSEMIHVHDSTPQPKPVRRCLEL